MSMNANDLKREQVAKAKAILYRRNLHRSLVIRLEKLGHSNPEAGATSISLLLKTVIATSQNMPSVYNLHNLLDFSNSLRKTVELEEFKYRYATAIRIKHKLMSAKNLTSEQYDEMLNAVSKLHFFEYKQEGDLFVRK